MPLASAATVAALVERIPLLDAVSAEHHARALDWLASTDDVFRREPPATPAPHLVGYVAVVDPASRRLLLVDHRRSGLWLPAGGHVEPGEDPAGTVRREAREELGLEADLLLPGPVLLTWTPTTGPDSHVDVSLWYVLRADAATSLTWDRRELRGVRWWAPHEVAAAPAGVTEPHLGWFVRALGMTGALAREAGT
ncbi:NUDIX hydrolase [Kineosporia sp. A_224]|uniref:NUDIX hydrolase n=1 Tax=Kineosporia sp. A_224 TaxID=1962180 RepID=UPI0018E958A7|nr:NUDIX domain-containing protein [Kineosporia sp. A_224]